MIRCKNPARLCQLMYAYSKAMRLPCIQGILETFAPQVPSRNLSRTQVSLNPYMTTQWSPTYNT